MTCRPCWLYVTRWTARGADGTVRLEIVEIAAKTRATTSSHGGPGFLAWRSDVRIGDEELREWIRGHELRGISDCADTALIRRRPET